MEIHTPAVAASSLNAIKIIRNPLLLEKIAQHLPPTTLLHLRKTCAGWNETFLYCLGKLNTLNGIPLELEVFQVLNGIADHMRLQRLDVNVNLDWDISQRVQNAVLSSLFTTFLMTQRGTVRQLEVSVHFTPSSASDSNTFTCLKRRLQEFEETQIQIPKMENLNSFCLRYSTWVRFEEQTLGATFPALKRLEFEGWVGGGEVCFDHMYQQLRHEGVTDLVWNSNVSLSILHDLFPWVIRVEISIVEDKFGPLTAVWTNWQALESLHIRYSAEGVVRKSLDLDLLLSGICKPRFEKVKRQLAEMDTSEITLDALRWLRRGATGVGIGSVKYLRKLTVEVKDHESLAFSDIGGYLGLAFAPQSLQFEIKMWNDPDGGGGGARRGRDSLISGGCLAFIRAALGPLAVINL